MYVYAMNHETFVKTSACQIRFSCYQSSLLSSTSMSDKAICIETSWNLEAKHARVSSMYRWHPHSNPPKKILFCKHTWLEFPLLVALSILCCMHEHCVMPSVMVYSLRVRLTHLESKVHFALSIGWTFSCLLDLMAEGFRGPRHGSQSDSWQSFCFLF
jgi:hypothetical protein